MFLRLFATVDHDIFSLPLLQGQFILIPQIRLQKSLKGSPRQLGLEVYVLIVSGVVNNQTIGGLF